MDKDKEMLQLVESVQGRDGTELWVGKLAKALLHVEAGHELEAVIDRLSQELGQFRDSGLSQELEAVVKQMDGLLAAAKARMAAVRADRQMRGIPVQTIDVHAGNTTLN